MSKVTALILTGLVLANAAVYGYIVSFFQESELAVHFLDVGQADSQLIRGSRSTILIDAGLGARVIQKIDEVIPSYDRTIDIAILTHPNLDHIGGMLPALERYKVRLVVMTGVETTLAEYQKLKQALRERNVPILYAVKGERIGFGKSELLILHPDAFLRGTAVPKKIMNDTSVVAQLFHPALSALFTGDISSKVEERLLVATTTILKVAHHGSKYSSSEEFLKKVSPKWAVIQVGRNSYGHPTPEALSRLSAIGAKVYRTDLDGTVSFVVDRGVVKITTLK